jgi:hypothetical protein
MTTITVKVPGKAKDKLADIVRELGGEIISISSSKGSIKKNKLLSDIKQGLQEVKKIREGKSPAYTMSDLFDEK